MRGVFYKRDSSGRRKLTAIGFIVTTGAMFYGVWLLGEVVGRQTMPHRFAQAFGCRAPERNAAGEYFANACEKDINLRYCIFVDGEVQPHLCRTTLLAPGQGVGTYIDDRLKAKAESGADVTRVDVWSCNVPFEPGRVPTMNKPSIKENGCMPLKKGAEAE